ncbi:hypothetical protein D9619_004257 [Psilocybe cf. subviscida]|uniref:DUF6533 domain-containing protein n=1 Tax=Psilocybe cf. subviscida TaxID=2480587 RepID=A0A8H5BNI0_9AGAR|nr:hypothetical protein D9619_004257 [Psilocybe cf. subviscida]
MDSSIAAYQAMVSQYASVGALAVLTWDILDNIPDDYRILFVKQRSALSIPTVVYILSRMGAFAYAIISIIFDTAPVGHCALLNRLALAWCPISLGATGFLFLLRLRAVYNRDRFIVFTFFVLWVALLVGAALTIIGTKGGPVIGSENTTTGYCEIISVTALSFYGLLAPLVFDTLILLAISWRIGKLSTMHEPGVNVGKTINVMLFGTNLPAFTRSLLIDGQIYYL